jgi:hypothetical protein
VHIRRIARNAVFIMVAVMVMGGFLAGVAEATSATPASPAVTSSSAIHRMLGGCKTPAVCTFNVGIHGIILLQRFSCASPKGHGNITNPIFQILNACPNRVYYYNPGSKAGHCLNPHSNQSGVGRFGTVRGIAVSRFRTKCP